MAFEAFLKTLNGSPQGNRCFFHFTDTRNIPSIQAHGLLSRKRSGAQQIEIPAPGGNEISIESADRLGLDDYVHLCFFSSHPMEFRAKERSQLQETRFLRIDPSVIMTPGALICLGVSNKSGAQLLPAEEGVTKLDLEIIYTKQDWQLDPIKERLKVARLYELLIPNHIPRDMIRF